MRTAVSRLLDRLGVLSASCTAPSTTDQDIRAALERDASRYAGIAEWNIRNSASIEAACHRAADKYLTEPFRSVTDPSRWAGSLWRHLERSYSHYGLSKRPCRRVVTESLETWEPQINVAPPYSSTRSSG